jgi:pilus assembly protein Flp/PilA
MRESIKQFIRDEDGLTMVEYAVAGGLICAAAVAAFTLLGNQVAAVINYIVGVLQNSPGGAP